MKLKTWIVLLAGLGAGMNTLVDAQTAGPGAEPKVPRFSVDYMDRTVSPATNFYLYACGTWAKNNPIPPDKARWASFIELSERNVWQMHELLVAAADTNAAPGTPIRECGDCFAAALDTNRIEALGLKPIAGDLDRVAALKSTAEVLPLVADYQRLGEGLLFGTGVGPDEKDSSTYVFGLRQGGLSLPDRDYYLKPAFATQRTAYVAHVTRMFGFLGETTNQAAADAATVLALETELANASRSRVDLRDPDKNYNKFSLADLAAREPGFDWPDYLVARGLPGVTNLVVGQPEFFDALLQALASHPLADWQTYLRWHILHGAAGALPAAVDEESFNFFGKVLSGRQVQEPRWKRAVRQVDGSLGEALGQLYIDKYFPPEARARMAALVDDLKAVYQDHLGRVPWMTPATRAKALAKFARFIQKIGGPDHYRDYSSVRLDRGDNVGNLRRLAAFEEHRQDVRVGGPVDRTEWGMSPPTVNAYFNPQQNEIVFPAGILQPPFFDVTLDDAVNYGGIGVVIGHEITHGYDDQGRKYDADGDLNDWWTPEDARQFETRAEKVVAEYNSFEALPGLNVNGKLTLGENIADLGGVSIAYDALERALARHPEQRKTIDGFTPEKRFFLSFAQIWRTNAREAEVRRLITVDPHSPGQIRSVGPLVNYQTFFDAFNIKPGTPMWRAPELRANIW